MCVFDWIVGVFKNPNVVAAFAAIASAVAAFLSWRATEGQRKINANLQAFKFFESRLEIYKKIDDLNIEICKTKDRKIKSTLERLRKNLYEELYFCYENMCYAYNHGLVDKGFFKDMWVSGVVDACVNDTSLLDEVHKRIKENFQDSDKPYFEIAKVYKESSDEKSLSK